MKKIVPAMMLLVALFMVTGSYAATKAELAAQYCAQAIQLEEARMGDKGGDGVDAKQACALSEHTAEKWQCVVNSMKDNGYSMAQALNDCDCPKRNGR